MSEVQKFLRDAAEMTGMTAEAILAHVLHIDDGAFSTVIGAMDRPTRELALRLDREVRIRNPGLHYVMRTMFVGYRREGGTPSAAGERSQIFLSLIRHSSRLEVVLPVDPDKASAISNTQDLRGKGHHGVGNVRVLLTSAPDLDQFLSDFDDWLRPRA